MKNYFLLAILFFLCCNIITAQSYFVKTYGGNANEVGHAVGKTADGNYFLFGQTFSFGNGGQDMYLIKTDAEGNELWSQTYGISGNDFGISAQPLPDNGLILCGSFRLEGTDFLALVKTDANGQQLWANTYGGKMYRDVGQHVLQTADGGFLATGFTGSSFYEDIYIVRTDADGNVVWTSIIESPEAEEVTREIISLQDSSFMLVGKSSVNGSQDMLLVKIDGQGSVLWTKRYGTGSHEEGFSVDQTDDGGFIIAGFENFNGGNIWLLKTDEDGNEQWSQFYGGPGSDKCRSVKQTSDGGYVLAGSMTNGDGNSVFGYIVKTDSEGAVEWTVYPEEGVFSEFNDVYETDNGEVVALGKILPTFDGATDFYFIKITADGSFTTEIGNKPSKSLTAFPNPFDRETIIEINGDPAGASSMQLFDASGCLVQTMHQPSGNTFILDGIDLSPGFYFAHIRQGGDFVKTVKLIRH